VLRSWRFWLGVAVSLVFILLFFRQADLGKVGAALRAGLRHAVDIALPNLCPACREPVGDQGLCAACWSKLSFIAPPYCERLGIPFPYDPGPGVLSMVNAPPCRPAVCG